MSECFAELARDRYRLASGVHGELGVPFEDFEAHLKKVAQRYLGSNIPDAPRTSFVKSLHTNDLLLALSCAVGVNAGWQRFYTLYRKYLSDLSRHLLGKSRGLEELGETIWIDLFLPDRSGQSRIASYDGRSLLATWLRVVVSNRIINERQRRSLSPRNLDTIPEPADPSALENVESRVGRQRYQSMIFWAFEQALRCLTHREKLIVLMRYDQGLQLGEIARVFSVHQSTVTRQLERVVERLRCDVMELLSSQYGLNRAQVSECLSVASETFATSVSLLSFLKEHTGATGTASAHSGSHVTIES